MSPPNTAITMKTGTSQNFLHTRRKVQNSRRKEIIVALKTGFSGFPGLGQEVRALSSSSLRQPRTAGAADPCRSAAKSIRSELYKDRTRLQARSGSRPRKEEARIGSKGD